MNASVPASAMYSKESAASGVSDESPGSSISWAAIVAGAFASAAMGLILVALGAGLGFAAVSPWSRSGASAATMSIASAIWLLMMSGIASAIGGYLAGRLRAKWVNVHGDEVFFRDTAHGFVAWAVGTVITAAVLTSAAGSLLGATVKVAVTDIAVAGAGAAAPASGGIASGPSGEGTSDAGADPNAYYVDSLFRSDKPAGETADASMRAEIGRIFAAGLRSGDISPSDRQYTSQMIAARTGLTVSETDKRVSDVFTAAKAAATDAETKARVASDAARKAAAYASLWVFISLLVGAFCATYAATVGGRLRDGVKA